MDKFYKIAGLTVKMNSFGRTDEQADPYRCEPCEDYDFKIPSGWEQVREKYPNMSDDQCEYMGTGGWFYHKLVEYDGIMLHSSAIMMDGKAYLFSADSGTGKSTHTKLWMETFGDRVHMINDDKPAIRLEDGVWYAYGTPWSGKHDLSSNCCAPIGGIAMLERDEKNEIEPFGGPRAAYALLKQIPLHGSSRSRGRVLELLDKLMTQVPIWKLRCNMDPEAAAVAYEAMSGKKKEI